VINNVEVVRDVPLWKKPMLNSTKRSISLGVRLISIVVVLVTFILTGIGALQYSRTQTLYTKLVEEGLDAACVRMTQNLGGPLWTFNKEQTTNVLNSEMAQDALVAVVVRMGTDRTVFAGAKKTDAGQVGPISDEGALSKNLLQRHFDVPWEGNTIATGTVYYSLSSLKQTLHEQVVSTIVQTLVADLLLIVLIGLVLSGIVIRPLSALTAVANSVGSGNFAGGVVERAITALGDLAKKLHRDELKALTDTFNNMLVNLQARDAELEDHRKNLETLVAERTAALSKRTEEMRLVLDNVDEGLVLVAPDGTMAEERSAAFRRFFECAEDKVDACIFEDPKARAYFRLGFEQIAEDFMPMSVVLEQLPKQTRRGSSVFGLRYQPLMRDHECISVLFMIDDITDKLAVQQKDREQFEQIRVFERWMRDRNGFIEFFNEAHRLVAQVHDDRFASPEERLRVIHTIKGNASLFDVLTVAEVAHTLETMLADGEVAKAVENQASLVHAWDAFAKRVGLLIGEDLSERFELSRPELNDIINGLRKGLPSTEIIHRLVAITYEPMKLRFARIERQLRSLAGRLQKAPVECTIQGENVRLPPEQFLSFWSAFPHIVRNIADHGFETAEERERRGKPACNRVTLAVASGTQSIELTIADDGKGIAWDRVAEKAEALGMPHGTRRELVSALFSPGFSTASEVTAISGRGVGLAAIAVEVSKLNGTVSVESEPGQGTSFKFVFPAQNDSLISVIPLSVEPISAKY
jgi:two-component system chemotaxis sensor kinase CheA